MDTHHPSVEEAARIWLNHASSEAGMQAIKSIKSIPEYLVTPTLIADLAAALSTLSNGLTPIQRDVAQNYLDDLHDDMLGYE